MRGQRELAAKRLRSCSAATTVGDWLDYGRGATLPAARQETAQPSGSTRTRISTPRRSRPRATSTACRWRACGHGLTELTELMAASRRAADSIRQIGIRSVDAGEKRSCMMSAWTSTTCATLTRSASSVRWKVEGVDVDTHLHVSFDVDFRRTSRRAPAPPCPAANYREAQLVMEMIADSGKWPRSISSNSIPRSTTTTRPASWP